MPRKPRHLHCGIVIELGTRNCALESINIIEGVRVLCAYVGKVDMDCGVPARSTFPLHVLRPRTSRLSCEAWQLTGQDCASSVFLLVVA